MVASQASGNGPDAAAPPGPRRRRASATAGLLLAVLGILAWDLVVRTVVLAPLAQALGAVLVVWVPLVAAVAVAGSGGGRWRMPGAALRVTWMDPLWGLAVGLIARGLAGLVELAVLGRPAGSGARLEPEPSTAWLVLLVAPVLVAPFVEEAFFRGLLLGSLREQTRQAGASVRAAAALSIVVSALVFAALHVLDATTPGGATVAAASAGLLGIGTGVLAVATGRLGGAIIAHAVANGALVLTLLR